MQDDQAGDLQVPQNVSAQQESLFEHELMHKAIRPIGEKARGEWLQLDCGVQGYWRVQPHGWHQNFRAAAKPRASYSSSSHITCINHGHGVYYLPRGMKPQDDRYLMSKRGLYR